MTANGVMSMDEEGSTNTFRYSWPGRFVLGTESINIARFFQACAV